MVGLICFVQVVHYPLFSRVGPHDFIGFEAEHTRRTTLVVGVLMPLEAVTALWLAVGPPAGIDRSLPLLGLGLLAALWAVTWAVEVPMHRNLATQQDADTIKRLVRSNWLRTVLWTGRALLLVAIGISLPG